MKRGNEQESTSGVDHFVLRKNVRGNEQGPTSGEIMTTEEVAESFAKARASDRIVSVNVDRMLCRVPTDEQRAKMAEIAKVLADPLAQIKAKQIAKAKSFPWLEVLATIAVVSLMIAAICFAIVMLAGGKS